MRSSLIEKIYTKKSINKIKRKIKLLGPNCTINPISFLNIRIIVCLIMFFTILFAASMGYILAPVFTVGFYLLYEYFILDYRIKARARKLDYEALFFFEVLTLSLESGRDLKGAIDLTCKNIDSELSNEFKECIRAMTFGKTLVEVLNDMKERMPSDTINNVLLNITQSNVYGNSIIETLYRQVEYLRDKKVLEIRGVIAKMPVKVSVVSVLFFVPILLLMILSPVILNYIN